jgi:hypothetical protein
MLLPCRAVREALLIAGQHSILWPPRSAASPAQTPCTSSGQRHQNHRASASWALSAALRPRPGYPERGSVVSIITISGGPVETRLLETARHVRGGRRTVVRQEAMVAEMENNHAEAADWARGVPGNHARIALSDDEAASAPDRGSGASC